MKIFSTAALAALLLGASATMHSASVKAQIDDCEQLAIECGQGNQEACNLYIVGRCNSDTPVQPITLPNTTNNKQVIASKNQSRMLRA